MSNQIEADEMRESTGLDVGPGVVGDLLIGELDSWHVGSAKSKKTTTTLFEGIEAKDLVKIADTINSAIASEYGAL